MDKIPQNTHPSQHYSTWDARTQPPRGERATPTASAAAPGGGRLEPRGNNLTRSGILDSLAQGVIVAHPVRCKCRACPICGKGAGIKTRERLQAKAEAGMFSQPALLTLTVDRRNWQGPAQAHQAVTLQALIPRLMRRLGVKRWVWTLEIQTKTGDGWPHWHLLLDLATCGGRLDYKLLWHLWRDVWGVGGCDVSAKHKAAAADPLHAVNYITKYLCKGDAIWPTWCLESVRLRVVGSSRAVGRLVSDDDADGHPGDEPGDTCERQTPPPVWERVSHCSMRTALFLYPHRKRETAGRGREGDGLASAFPGHPPSPAEPRPQYLGTVDIAYADVADYAIRRTGGRMGYRGIVSHVVWQGERHGQLQEITAPGFTDAEEALQVLRLASDTCYRRLRQMELQHLARVIQGQWERRTPPPANTEPTPGALAWLKPPTERERRRWWARVTGDTHGPPAAGPQGTQARLW